MNIWQVIAEGGRVGGPLLGIETQVWLGLFTLVGIFVTAFFQFRTAKLMHHAQIQMAEAKVVMTEVIPQKLKEIHDSTNGSLSRLLETQEGMRAQLLQAGITPVPAVLKGRTDAAADNMHIEQAKPPGPGV